MEFPWKTTKHVIVHWNSIGKCNFPREFPWNITCLVFLLLSSKGIPLENYMLSLNVWVWDCWFCEFSDLRIFSFSDLQLADLKWLVLAIPSLKATCFLTGAPDLV